MARPERTDLTVVPLDSKRHDRAAFHCGNDALDLYLQTIAAQDMRRKANAVFVLAAGQAPERILGYFTLCAFSVDPGGVPEQARRHIPRYPLISATLIGRLAIECSHQGQGLGSLLLANALRKAWDSADQVGSCMVVVDAIDNDAERFYRAHGFVKLPDSRRLIIPMHTIGEILRKEQ